MTSARRRRLNHRRGGQRLEDDVAQPSCVSGPGGSCTTGTARGHLKIASSDAAGASISAPAADHSERRPRDGGDDGGH